MNKTDLSTATSGQKLWQTAPVIASIIAAIILMLLHIPGVLVFPENMDQPPAEMKRLAEKANEVLRQRIAAMKNALDANICVADGQFTTPTGSLPDDIVAALPGPSLDTVHPSQGAVQNLRKFEGSVSDLIDKTVVFVRVPVANNKLSMGSGVFVSPDLVLTNAHVVETDTSPALIVYNETIGSLNASIVAIGKSAAQHGVDLAVLRVQNPPADQAFLTLANAQQGQTVTAAGFPMVVMESDPKFMQWLRNPQHADPQKQPFIDTQILSLIQIEGDSVEWLYHTATIDKGNSGGPLLDDCGYLIGINTGAAFRKTSEQDTGDIKIPFSKAIGRSTIEQFFANQGLPSLSGHAGSCNPEASM